MGRIGFSYHFIFVSALFLILVGCNPGDSTNAGDTTVVIDPANDVVCDPFGNGQGSTAGQGIVSNLYYLTDSQPRYSTVEDNINYGTQANVTLYLNDINVPTRLFSEGFTTQTGATLVDNDGNTLYEYFALRMQANIALGPNDPEGDYQFAVLSDDGSILSVDTGGGLTPLISDDDVHPTRMGCTTQSVHMSPGMSLPMQLDYFQGPRYQIAMVLLWRQIPTDPTQVTDPLCGQEGNSLFYDYTQTPSAPQQAYVDLLSRGWQPLQPANYLLPQSVGANNPCTASNPNVISNVQITNLTQTSATFTWVTTEPSTSYVSISPYPPSVYDLEGSNTLVTNHSVTISTLSDFTVYSFTVQSTDASGSQVTNDPTTFRTLR